MKSDRPLTAAFLGILSTLPYEIFTRIFLYLGYGIYSLYQLDSTVVTINKTNVPIGFVVSCSVSVLTSVIFYFLINAINSEHLVIKSILFSVLIWTTTELIFTAVIEGKFIPIRPIDDYYSHMLGAVVYGITQGLLFKQLLFSKHTY